jgi:probable HAF family extracellular repeat protein
MATKMRLSAHGPRIVGSMLAAVALWGCQETPTEPPASLSLSRAAVGTYTVVDLGTLGGSFSYSEATGINSAGHVVGMSNTTSDEFHAFFWEKGP